MRVMVSILSAAILAVAATGAGARSDQEQAKAQAPKGFDGCWQGTFTKPDTYKRLGGPPVGDWVPVTYQLCFERGAKKQSRATFKRSNTESIDAKIKGLQILNFESETRIVGTDGEKTVDLKIDFSFDQPSGPNTAHMSAANVVQCVLRHSPLIRGGRIMVVNMSQIERCGNIPDIKCEGQPWLSSKWHAEFHPVSAE